MDVFAFIAGLSLGLGLCTFKYYQRNRQLKQMIDSLAQGTAEDSDLPVLSRLRREIYAVNEDRQHLEAELSIWKQVLEAAPIGYLQVDEENQVLWCNQVSRHLLRINRWNPQELRLLLELVRSYELDRLIERTRKAQRPQVEDWVFQTTQLPGEKTPTVQSPGVAHSIALRASSIPLEGRCVGVFLENRQPLVELNQARDRAFSDLTHELRTPLTSIRLVAETLQNRLQGVERTWVDKMLQETNRLIELIQNCLEISQLEKNPAEHLSYESIELKSLILELWQTLEPLAKAKELTLNYSGCDPLYLQGDRARLTQVFLNLFDNSIQYSPPQTSIQVEVEQVETLTARSESAIGQQKSSKDGRWIIINIIDSGCGFNESDLPYVFERLYRGDRSRVRPSASDRAESPVSRSGSGLGLSIAQQIVQAHGGSITAQNHPKTGGAWLKIRLPNIT
jgi:two-component system, OmpR family, phosphate regulon sensor histidine kinase PhoR